mmetsp:Transcript_17852/g.50279  ORF Transcript_17852/g.50279 Transcript_17852/m.50279 type:complete len:289 (+) Transcript_17852:198-1064(+)|eukprot:CAMPEP_0119135894 /NCGR_PEP_ID=MMETSP1310-20130426/20286_1 /TAXON_ID=464262 /ORGANISM="Genus nov. species nov., Strain RCC2339" /LENGTH=288 /DNA_ID=CAMNT_0007126839 /DNA_START=120 /DNA_END=986 /DNA_ORIENTATION=+
MEEELGKLRERIKELEGQAKEDGERMAMQGRAVQDLEDMNQRVAAKLERTKAELHEREKDVRDLRNTDKERKAIQEMVDKERARVKQLEVALAQEQRERRESMRDAEQVLEEHKVNEQTARREMGEANAAMEGLLQRVSVVKGKCEALEEENQRLRQVAEEAEMGLESSRAETRRWEEKVMVAEQEAESLRMSVQMLKQQAEKARAENAELEAIIVEQEEKLTLQTIENNRRLSRDSERVSHDPRRFTDLRLTPTPLVGGADEPIPLKKNRGCCSSLYHALCGGTEYI